MAGEEVDDDNGDDDSTTHLPVGKRDIPFGSQPGKSGELKEAARFGAASLTYSKTVW
jgi:hypothetical protein